MENLTAAIPAGSGRCLPCPQHDGEKLFLAPRSKTFPRCLAGICTRSQTQHTVVPGVDRPWIGSGVSDRGALRVGARLCTIKVRPNSSTVFALPTRVYADYVVLSATGPIAT